MNLNWDSDNKLRSADIDANGTADVNFQYDALGRRVARSGTGGSVVYVQMDQQTIADYPVGGAATTPTFRYVYASYIDEPVVRKTAGTGGTLVYFHRNHQYSITAVTTSTGSIAERYAYTAYGQPTILDASGTVLQTSNFSLRYSFTGREWDATLGLYHFRARWMNPSAGRFVGRDPIGYEGSPYDLYEYCESNPIRFLDPFGYGICGLPDDLNLNDEEALKNFMKNLSPQVLRRIRDCLKRQRPDIWGKWVKAEKYTENRNKIKRRNNKGKGKPKKGIITRCGLKYLFLAECEFLCAYGYSLCLDSASVGQEDCGDRCRGLPFSEQQDCIDNCFYIWTLDAAECGIIYTACGLACLTPIPDD
jgi:RHS repeat-associated protein